MTRWIGNNGKSDLPPDRTVGVSAPVECSRTYRQGPCDSALRESTGAPSAFLPLRGFSLFRGSLSRLSVVLEGARKSALAMPIEGPTVVRAVRSPGPRHH